MRAKGKRFGAAVLACLLAVFLSACSFFSVSGETEGELSKEQQDYAAFTAVYENEAFREKPYAAANRLCVTAGDVALAGYTENAINGAAGLFNVTGETVLYASQIFSECYPASTTKVLTALVVLTHANLEDSVTVGEEIRVLAGGNYSMANLSVGDVLTVRDLLYALLLPSGNDAALTLAVHTAGSVEAFVELMNQTAAALQCTSSHFVNPHGLQDTEHYTTAYDLYLIFNEAIKNETFTAILDTPAYTAEVTHADGTVEMLTWEATNYYFQGLAAFPANVTILGGKTGTTDEAGSCLILYAKDSAGRAFIAVILNAETKTDLYENMTALLSAIPPDGTS